MYFLRKHNLICAISFSAYFPFTQKFVLLYNKILLFKKLPFLPFPILSIPNKEVFTNQNYSPAAGISLVQATSRPLVACAASLTLL